MLRILWISLPSLIAISLQLCWGELLIHFWIFRTDLFGALNCEVFRRRLLSNSHSLSDFACTPLLCLLYSPLFSSLPCLLFCPLSFLLSPVFSSALPLHFTPLLTPFSSFLSSIVVLSVGSSEKCFTVVVVAWFSPSLPPLHFSLA